MLICIFIDQYLDGDSDVSSHRPDPLGQDTNYERHSFGRPGKFTNQLILIEYKIFIKQKKLEYSYLFNHQKCLILSFFKIKLYFSCKEIDFKNRQWVFGEK